MAIIFNLPDNYDYRLFQQHIFNDSIHFGSGERNTNGNITIGGTITASEFIGKGVRPEVIRGGDLNKFTAYGEYYSPAGYTYTNGPVDGNYVFFGVLKVFRIYDDDGYVIQMLIQDSGSMHIRKLYAADPTSVNSSKWFKILNEDEHVAGTNLHLTEEDRDILSKSLPVRHTIELSTANWSNNTQSISVDGVNADESTQLITIVPDSSSAAAYRSCEVYAMEQNQNELVFACSTIPQKALAVYITIQEVNNG